MRCLLEFLAFMHSKGLMHRDLKPGNIMLSSRDPDATIKIIDFGTADFCPADRRFFNKFGTPLYVAPEVSSECKGAASKIWNTDRRFRVQDSNSIVWNLCDIRCGLMCCMKPHLTCMHQPSLECNFAAKHCNCVQI